MTIIIWKRTALRQFPTRWNNTKIKPAVEEMLLEKGYTFEQDPSGGLLLVQIVSGTPESPITAFFNGIYNMFASFASFCVGRR